MTSTWVFVVWLLLPTSPAPVPVFGHGASLAECQATLMAHLQGDSVMVTAGNCVRHDSWLYLRPPAAPIYPPAPWKIPRAVP